MYVELKMEGNVFTSFGGLSGHSSTETRKIFKNSAYNENK